MPIYTSEPSGPNQKSLEELKIKLQKSLQSENIVILSGAGSSVEAGGKTMPDLWDIVEANIENFDTRLTQINYSQEERDGKNLEHLLSKLQIKRQSLENDGVEDTPPNPPAEPEGSILRQINDFIGLLTEQIVFECRIEPEEGYTTHEFFLKKLLKARKNIDKRIKIFTLNYDTLFEDAADKIDSVLIDGFSFSQKGFFNSNNYNLDIVHREKSRIHNEESFYNKVLHLYKIHGSVNWDTDGSHIWKSNFPENPVLIYPNSSKFEKSYEMPFFEMMSRFQNSLREPNTSLFIIGYSFGDEHINRIIKESIKNNYNLEIFVIKRNINPIPGTPNLIDDFHKIIESGFSDLHLVASGFTDFVTILPEVTFSEPEMNTRTSFFNTPHEQPESIG